MDTIRQCACMVYFKVNYNFPRFQKGLNNFQGGGPTFTMGRGSDCLLSIETHITCVFRAIHSTVPLLIWAWSPRMSQNLHDHFVTKCLHKGPGCKHVSVIQICKIFKALDDILMGLIDQIKNKLSIRCKSMTPLSRINLLICSWEVSDELFQCTH